MRHDWKKAVFIAAIAVAVQALPGVASAWEPEKGVQIVIPAGPGGASDQLGRTLQAIIAQHELIKTPLSVVNKPGANSAESLLDVASSKSDPHKLLVALSNLFVVPLASDIAFHWTDLSPVAILAFDEFVLWVNAKTPYMTAADYLEAIKADPDKFRMGGTQAKNDDQILTVAIEKAAGVKLPYVPFKSGGEVTTQLAGEHITSNVNNPGESVGAWKGGQVRPLCVFADKPIPYDEVIADEKAWTSIPLCKDQGLNITFNVLRAIMLPAGVKPEEREFYVSVLRKVSETPEWKAYLRKNGLRGVFLPDEEAVSYMNADERRYKDLMTQAGFVHPSRK